MTGQLLGRYFTTIIRGLIYSLCGVLAVGPLLQEAEAQPACPYSESQAIPDTFDPEGYYPLAVGNTWEYEEYSGAFPEDLFRKTVVSDTLLNDHSFHAIEHVWYAYEGSTPITHADTSYSFLAVVDGTLSEWSTSHGIVASHVDFSLPFNSCIEADSAPVILVGGYLDSTYTFRGTDPVHVPAVKDFSVEGGSHGEAYAYGIGPILYWGDPDYRRRLTFARIGEKEYGERLESRFDIRVATEDGVRRGQNTSLTAYPNPASSVVKLVFESEASGTAVIDVFDSLGRRVKTLGKELYIPAGKEIITWNAEESPPGLYIVKLRHAGIVLNTSVVLL